MIANLQCTVWYSSRAVILARQLTMKHILPGFDVAAKIPETSNSE